METLRADETPMWIFTFLTEPVEVVDGDGRPVGRFTPDPAQVERIRAETSHPLDPVEMQRQLSMKGPARSTREVFEHLLTLTTEPGDREHLVKLIEEIRERDGWATP